MTRPVAFSARMDDLGSGARLSRRLCLFAGIAILLAAGALPLPWQRQLMLGVLSVLAGLWLDRSSDSYRITLALIGASMCSTFRYALWRLSTVGHFFLDPLSKWSAIDAFFIGTLVLAESYAFFILYFGYLQTVWPLRRPPAPLPRALDEWPAIDLLIPTYNEPLNVVRHTALAALNIDWPPEKLHVYLLDDGTREEFQRFAAEAGVGYITRVDHSHAKAGNINQALGRMHSPLVAIFDCDHVPTRSFLQVTAGWFLRDPKLGMLQTPHHFYSPDPFERNLGQFRSVPNEGELFYGVVQDANDFWNATFFCGSCAILRRSALDQIGGIAVETVTEDAHTSLRMQMNGWNTAYINIPQAAGLATERLSGHVKQRIRWARGMIQILRTDNPLFAKGLRPMQRLCYFNAMTHFLYALPRLIFLSAPLIFLVLGHTNVPGTWVAIFAYALPHLVLSSMANSRIQGRHRHSFWNEIYETVLAPYILLPTMLALFSPKLGKFNVTAKGGVVDRGFFDSRIALPFLVMLGFNVLGLLCAIPRLWQMPVLSASLPLAFLVNWPAAMYDSTHAGTVVMNVLWTILNSLILGVALGVAAESQQRRQTVRLTMQVPARVRMLSGEMLAGITADVSSGGVMLQTDLPAPLRSGDPVTLLLQAVGQEAELPAVIVRVSGTELRAQFEHLTMAQEEALTQVIYARADTWLHWDDEREADRPLHSLWHILHLAVRGLYQTLIELTRTKRASSKGGRGLPKLAVEAVPLTTVALAVAVGLCLPAQQLRAQTRLHAQAHPERQPGSRGHGGLGSTSTAAQLERSFTFADAGGPTAIQVTSSRAANVSFRLSVAKVATGAQIRLRYRSFLSDRSNAGYLQVGINGLPLVTLPLWPEPLQTKDPGQVLDGSGPAQVSPRCNRFASEARCTVEIAVPAVMVVRQNNLTFSLVSKGGPAQGPEISPSVFVDGESSILLRERCVTLPRRAAPPPMPFYDPAEKPHSTVQVAFLRPPSAEGIRAAAILASWIGMSTAGSGVGFRVTIGAIPSGNAIVIDEAQPPSPLPTRALPSQGREVALQANPRDSGAVVLQLAGNPSQLVAEANAISSDSAQPSRNESIVSAGLSSRAPATPVAGDGASGRNLSESTLPDLALFARTGFPFTRSPDLSQTTVVMPGQPTADELSVLLSLIGRFGAITGAPASGLAVDVPAGLDATGQRDIIVIGSAQNASAVSAAARPSRTVAATDQPAFARLNPFLPVALDEGERPSRVRYGPLARLWSGWWKLSPIRVQGMATSALAEDSEEAIIEGTEWPRGSGRSVVLIAIRDSSAVPVLQSALLNPTASTEIAHSVGLLKHGHLVSIRAGEELYRAGPIFLSLRILQLATGHLELVVGSLFLICVLLAGAVEDWLRKQATLRLQSQAP